MSNKLPQRIEHYAPHYTAPKLWDKLRSVAMKAGRKVVYHVLLLYYVLTNPTTPPSSKRLIIGVLGYFILPVDLIPDVLPGTGFADDLLALLYVVKVLHDSITPQIQSQAEEQCNKLLK